MYLSIYIQHPYPRHHTATKLEKPPACVGHCGKHALSQQLIVNNLAHQDVCAATRQHVFRALGLDHFNGFRVAICGDNGTRRRRKRRHL